MKYLIIMLLAVFVIKAEMKIEIFDEQGNKIKEVINHNKSNTNIISQNEIILHNQKIKIQNLEKENKDLKNQIKNLKNQIHKLNSDLKFQQHRLEVKELAEKNEKILERSLDFLTLGQYVLFGAIILSIIGWIISLFTKKRKIIK